MEKKNYIHELKSFISSSKNHLFFLMNNFGFLPALNHDQKYLENSVHGTREKPLDMADIIKLIEEHLKNSESSSTSKSSSTLPSFHSDNKVTCIIEPSIRKNLLQPIRENNPLPEPAITCDEYFANYSAIEKNILYHYALSKTSPIQTPPELCFPEATPVGPSADEGELTDEQQHARRLELLKRERDLKRRRIAYRKKVSTKNKSHTEVTKEIISNLMEALFGEKMEAQLCSSNKEHPTPDNCSKRDYFDKPKHVPSSSRSNEQNSRYRRERRFSFVSEGGNQKERCRTSPRASGSVKMGDKDRSSSPQLGREWENEKYRDRLAREWEKKYRDKLGREWEKEKYRDRLGHDDRYKGNKRDDRNREYENKDRIRGTEKNSDKRRERRTRESEKRESRGKSPKRKKTDEYNYQSGDYYEVRKSSSRVNYKVRKEYINSSSSEDERKRKRRKKRSSEKS